MDVESLAAQLLTARRNGGRIDVSSVAGGLDVAAVYEVQRQLLQISGERPVGYKIGATSEVSMELLRLREPFHGPLLEQHCHRSGYQLSMPAEQQVLVEAEIAVQLAADLPPSFNGYSVEQIAKSIAWIAPAIEICSFRFRAELKGNGKLAIADGGINLDFVYGEQIGDFGAFDLSNRSVSLLINGAKAASGNSSVLMTRHPFGLVAWLANAPFLRGEGLRKGDLITTGSCTGLTAVKSGDAVTADFGDLGHVELRSK